MSKSSKEITETHYDTRTLQRYLRMGVISQSDYQSHLKNLPNDEDNFELAPFEDDSDLELDADIEDTTPETSDLA